MENSYCFFFFKFSWKIPIVNENGFGHYACSIILNPFLALPLLDVEDFNPLEQLLEDCNWAFLSTRMVLVYTLLFPNIMFFV